MRVRVWKLLLGGILFANVLANTLLAIPIASQELPPASTLDTVECPKQIMQQLLSWQSMGEWRRLLNLTPGAETFRTPTKKVGQWIQFDWMHDTVVKMTLLNEKVKKEVVFLSQCKTEQKAIKLIASEQKPEQKLKFFTDTYLTKQMKKNRNGLIYFWSPYMYISYMGLEQALFAARSLNLRFYAVIPDIGEEKEALKMVQKLPLLPGELMVNRSSELKYRQMDIHFPSFLLYSEGKILKETYRGYEDAVTYQKYLSDYLNMSPVSSIQERGKQL